MPPPTLGPLLSIGHLGVMIGAIVFSMVADKIGRRPVLIYATLFFAIMTIATAFAQNVQQMLWLRFIAGLGLGCIIPNATALVGEFSPKRTRVAWVMCITMGFTLGAAIGGFVANALIPRFGWRSVFVFGGIVPLVVAIGMFLGLPESLQFLAVRKQKLRPARALAEAARSRHSKSTPRRSSSRARRASAACRSGICSARAARS